MQFDRRSKIFLLIAILSFLISYLIVTIGHFPHLGFAVSFSLFIILAYKLIKDKEKGTRLYFTFTLVFSALIFVRSEPLITFFNLIAVFVFTILTLLPKASGELYFSDFLYGSGKFLLKSFFAKESQYSLSLHEQKNELSLVKVGEWVFGVFISLILAAIVLPLLSSANPFFKNLVDSAMRAVNLENWLKYFGYQNVLLWLLRLLFFVIFIFLLPKLLTLINSKDNYKVPYLAFQNKLPLSIPKFFIALVVFVFFFTQIQFYFAGDATLSGMGMSHSQRTREVFTQLSLVAGIILLLVYNAGGTDRFNRISNWLLGVQGVFLTLMAYNSVFSYISAWGLTYKRLYGLAFATWVVGIFVLFFINYKKGTSLSWFVKKSILYSGILLILVNILNFDYLIYHFGKSKTGQGVDYRYLSTLSPDSLSYQEQFDRLEKIYIADNYQTVLKNGETPLVIFNRIQRLQTKYSQFNFRSFNLLDYLQYLKIKSLDTNPLNLYYKNKLYPQYNR
ncbi:MAG: hypothetical protein UT39_C0014G0031 [Candidatus Woesebacteria bacterium GW2011_GWA1_39_21]|uniref:Uncharacterized protein n=1 Tax=Candidatus Woesebacteria bacterium GW2011_GWA1_39_21 TaxID=1618550 RepID=A0A0G0RAW6_9BACT|nr:MAG: hypothetical protein UT39_C0014G0031 [Candidatus Woesebacteria bacterium GW2011_GWA1_39_21]